MSPALSPAALPTPENLALTELFVPAAALFVVLAIMLFYRAVAGPTTQDRLLAVNVLGTNTVVILALLSVGLDEPWFLDVALVYALLNFLMAIAISKFTVERGGVL
ncbi:monovalent cation/H+ antiporter subunit F [Natrialba aegyptia DSM 13077]|uniref:Monovalent cation/H+ antiporter subunit F n=3 Tax=Natrialbaceae TaxID=1644061 RepID=M0BJ71_9EURY|nr:MULTISPECIES: cation:proton antiporter [Natrialba]ELY85616.1 monovalent cation/H+ antiporter subunit F [Natrialba taiwanensis DSM 12281]ELZ10353.1 monovalent cation/H+ antiporter subunit F [Natrialba aegyptia DSM 13077]